MVKGISRQVILVHSPDPRLFEQAIFILKDNAASEGISEDALVKEAEQVIRRSGTEQRRGIFRYGIFWAAAGSLLTGAVWAATILF